LKAPGDYGGQRANMEHDSMRGTLAAQARVVWPVERRLLESRHGTSLGRVLDVGCGTGEILRRLRADFDCRLLVGADLFAGHLRFAPAPVVLADGHTLPFDDGSFDLVLVRHLLQALPDPTALLAEAHRVLAPGGRIHVVAEDYLGIFFDADDAAVENHFAEVQPSFLPSGTDLYQGRRALRHLRAAGFRRVQVDPLFLDNQSADRDSLAAVFRHWGEGYASTLAALSGRSEDEMVRRFSKMEKIARDPDRYCAWLLFALDGVKA
jgi:SAM-dependent methyltransferase